MNTRRLGMDGFLRTVGLSGYHASRSRTTSAFVTSGSVSASSRPSCGNVSRVWSQASARAAASCAGGSALRQAEEAAAQLPEFALARQFFPDRGRILIRRGDGDDLGGATGERAADQARFVVQARQLQPLL